MKSLKRWYRKWDLDVTQEAVKEAVAKYATQDQFEKYSKSFYTGPNTPADTESLNGKTIVFRGEDLVLQVDVATGNDLYFTDAQCSRVFCKGNVKTLDEEVFFLNFLVPGYELGRQITLVADMKTGYATVCDAHFGTPYSNTDVGREFFFGKLDGNYPEKGEMHHFTNEMVGKAVIWDYAVGPIELKHIYSSNLYYSYSMKTENGAWMSTNPADYIKVRDNYYIFSFVEERQPGLQALFLMDFSKMHDVGSFFGVGKDHVSSACVGAIGKFADFNTIFE